MTAMSVQFPDKPNNAALACAGACLESPLPYGRGSELWRRVAHRESGEVNRRGAFSMVELVLIITVVSIMAAIAAPRYADFMAQQRLTAAGNRIRADLGLAQRQARFTSASLTVSFNVASDSYGMAGVPDPDHPQQNYVVQMDESPYEVTIVSANFGGDAKVIFDGYGVPDSSGSVVIQIGVRQRTITLDGKNVVEMPSSK